MVIITKIEVTGRCVICYAVLFKIWSVCGSILLKMQTLRPQSFTFGGEAQESAFYHSLWTIPMCATVRSVHLELPCPIWQSVATCSS